MKITVLNNVQHRELAPDFNERFHSNWVDPPWHQVASAEQYCRFYQSALEEHVYARAARVRWCRAQRAPPELLRWAAEPQRVRWRGRAGDP